MRWHGRSVGGIWAIAASSAAIRLLGWRGVALATPWIAWAVIFMHAGARRSLDRYWSRREPSWAGDRRVAASVAHITSFLSILADRVVVPNHPTAMTLAVDGPDGQRMHAALADPRGCVLLSAHAGNWELSAHLLTGLTNRRVHIVMADADPVCVRQILNRAMGPSTAQIIDPRDGFAAALAIGHALSAGEIVCMLGDRRMPGQPSVAVSFLGGAIHIPAGPYHAAMATGAQVLPCFLAKQNRRTYRLLVGAPWTGSDNRRHRAEFIADGAQAFITALAAFLNRRPRQWHNFYDPWRSAET